MKKLLVIFLMFSLFVVAGCEDEKKENDEDQTDDQDVTDVQDNETEDQEVEDKEVSDDDGDCAAIDSEWMEPEEDWEAWSYLKMMGPIADYEGEYQPAVYTDGKAKTSHGTTEFTDGSFMNYQDSVLLADAAAYEFIDVDQAAGTAVVDYWDIMLQVSLQLIPLMVEQGAYETGFGATVSFRHTFIDVTINASGQVTSQQVRKNCYLAVSKTEEVEEEGETYNVPIGDIYGCFEDNVDGSVGEDLKMMFKNELTEAQADLLTAFNEQQDGTVLEYGDEGFMHICQCYDEEGTEIDCWAYDGPGGSEECPDYVPEGDCVVPETDDDAVNDADAADENDFVPDDDAQ